MQHVSTGHVGDGLDGAFGDPVLVMSANTTEAQGLSKACAMLTKLIGAKDAIVRVELPDGNANMCCFGFKEHLTTNGIAGSSGQLVVNVDERATVVDVDGATREAIARRTVSGRESDASRNR